MSNCIDTAKIKIQSGNVLYLVDFYLNATRLTLLLHFCIYLKDLLTTLYFHPLRIYIKAIPKASLLICCCGLCEMYILPMPGVTDFVIYMYSSISIKSPWALEIHIDEWREILFYKLVNNFIMGNSLIIT